MALGPHTVTRLRGVAILDPYSQEATDVDWDSPAELVIPGCSVQPGPPQAQDLTMRDSVTTLFTVWAPGSPDVTEKDRVNYAGTVYAIDDTIQRWSFGAGHTVIPLKRMDG